jgi:GT2 family glycosyltransferase
VPAADLAVVIPTRERWEILARTLDGLADQTEQGFETIIAVDGSDQVVPRSLSHRDGVQVLAGERAGPGSARNRAVGATERPLLLFLGDDTLPVPTLVARHLERHRQRPEIEVAVLGHVDWHPEIAGNRLLRWLDWSGSQFDYHLLAGRRGEDVGFGRFYSSNVSVKRELFLDAGGFDPDFHTADYEDIELGWRLHERGLRLIYEPAALAHHLHAYDWEAVQRRYHNRAGAERVMSAKHAWFRPWFYDRFTASASQPRASALWPRVVDYVPRRAGPLRTWVETRADRWYHQQLAPVFFGAWEQATDGEEAGPRAQGR